MQRREVGICNVLLKCHLPNRDKLYHILCNKTTEVNVLNNEQISCRAILGDCYHKQHLLVDLQLVI